MKNIDPAISSHSSESSSSLSPSGGTLTFGRISVAVPVIGNPGTVPSGISLDDSVPVMAASTRSGDLQRLEEAIRASLGEVMEKMAAADRAREHSDRLRDQALQELRDDFSALYVQHTELMSKIQSGDGHDRSNQPAGRNYFTTRQSKIGFPVFTGDDLNGWLFRCKHFFVVDQTPPEEMVKIAVINLEGRALQWFHSWAKFRRDAINEPWETFVTGLEERFGDKLLGDPMAELLALKQSGNISDYHDQFESLLGRVDVSESYAVSFFLNGLKFHIQKAVRMFMPKTIHHALSLARLHESASVASFQSGRRSNSHDSGQSAFNSKPPLLPSPASSATSSYASSPSKPRRALTSEELDDKRAKGLCYWCNEKYERGHRCARRQLYLIELPDEDEGVQNEDVGEQFEEEGGDNPHISMHAIHGSSSRSYKTMRVSGKVGKKTLNILIDSGSTHYFLDLQLAKKLGLRLIVVKPMKVDVADGNSITCEFMSKAIKWSLQDTLFTTDVLLLPLGQCDMVLGIQWLETLGVIQWDFKNLTMSFYLNSKKHVLRGSTKGSDLQAVSGKNLSKILGSCEELQLCCLKLRVDADVQRESNGENPDQDLVTPACILEFLAKQEAVFKEPTTLPPFRSHNHQIVLKDGTQPISIRPYRHTSIQKDIIEKIVGELLQNGFIQHSCSPFSSPVVLVKKKDGSWRMCIDYRALNKHTVKDKYPIPLIDELLEELHGAAIFSKIDLRAGYHQIRMKEEDIAKTAFRTHSGHYEFVVMPFGLTNAPATFQGLMNDVFRPYLRKFVLVFFDDILIYSTDLSSHLEHLELVFGKLKEFSLFAKHSKCSFGLPQVEYLGHTISKAGVSTDQKKIQAMLDWPTPSDVTQLRGFLGLTGYYRKFIRNYGIICRPLTDLLKKDSFLWNEGADVAFKELKGAMTQSPVLALPNFDLPFIIETDASSFGIGAVLMQAGHPIAFISKALSPKLKLLSVYDKELLAIVFAVTYWSHYLGNRHFTVKTDHKTLSHLMKQKLSTPGQLTWLSKLMAFDFDITYKEGKENVVADALSRVHSSEIICMAISTVSVDLYPLIEATWSSDNKLAAVIEGLKQNPDSKSKFTWIGNQLRRKGRLVVGSDEALRLRIIQAFHDSSTGGHSGVLATYKRLCSLFYWPKMERNIRVYIQGCDICQRNKYDHNAYPGLLQPLPIPEEAWSQVSLDFIEGLPLSYGKSTILVVVDRLTKYAHFMCLSHPYTAMTVAQTFLDYVFKLHGLPSVLISDRDTIFLSKFWKDLFKLQGVELSMSTAYHPQSDGQTEVVNRCLETYLRCMCGDQPSDWSRWISLAEFWYNTSYHSAIDCTPFEALYGYPPPIHIPYFRGDSAVQSVHRSLQARDAMLQVLKHHLARAQKRMKTQHDKHRSDRNFEVGDWVYLKLQPYRQNTLRDHQFQKLGPRYFGPYRIVDKIGEVAYKLLLPASSKLHPVFHVSQLKKRVGTHQPISDNLPAPGNATIIEPVKILDRRLVKRGNRPATQVLIQWSNSFEEDATWEYLYDITTKFPDFQP